VNRVPDRLFAPPAAPEADTLRDLHGRHFAYLRLSLTDICNFRCSYCLPDGYRKPAVPKRFMSADEIERAVRSFARLGVWKIRLTGGEPTIRPDFLDIAARVAATEGVRTVALTTNGYRLPERAQSYFDAGIRAINISIDSLGREGFAAITGHDRLGEVMAGIAAARAAGFETIKINTVLLKGLNDDELDDFLAFVRDQSLSLRFIELMRTNDNVEYFNRHHIPGDAIIERLGELGWDERARAPGAGPARIFGHAGSSGTIGVIAPYAEDFCATCNRLRLSATGKLHLCLFGEAGYDLRPLLRHDDQHDALAARISGSLRFKQAGHFLHDGDSGATPHFASIGG